LKQIYERVIIGLRFSRLASEENPPFYGNAAGYRSGMIDLRNHRLPQTAGRPGEEAMESVVDFLQLQGEKPEVTPIAGFGCFRVLHRD
jgi:hypothetical protein